MKKAIFKGSGVALITPFDETGAVDFKRLEKLLEFHTKNGTDAIIVCGTTGEASTLEIDEYAKIIKEVAQYLNHKIPLIAGSSSNSTKHAIELSKTAQKSGADCLLITPPYYNKTSQKGLISHFSLISASVDLPILLYNIPGRTGGLSFSIETFIKLSKIENIIGVKEASGDIDVSVRIVRETNLVLYSGNDDATLPVMSLGGLGVISVIANILPFEVHKMCEEFLNGKLSSSRDMFINMYDLVKMLFIEVNPIPIKSAMKLMNLDSGILRLPLCEIEKNNLEKLRNSMLEYGIKIE